MEPEKAVQKVQDRLKLDMTDEEAIHYLSSLINESIQGWCNDEQLSYF
jgi:phosphatidylinositol 3-kinase